MSDTFTEIIPKKVLNPQSLEDIGWNNCCEEYIKKLALLVTGSDREYPLSARNKELKLTDIGTNIY
ncbi:MAG: hypothetical protein WC695_00665 [Candidatus Omnitrophota bacterium]